MKDDRGWIPEQADVGRPSAARMYDYALGGGHNLATDRELFERVLLLVPKAREMAWNNRAFLRRAVLFMIDAGIRQFLDLGSGIPTVGNVHEIAQKADAASRVVYVDRDDVAVAHSRLILAGNDLAAIVEQDITRPAEVLRHPETRRLLDFGRPIGLLAVTIGHYIPDEQDVYGIFDRYRDAVAPGSVLAITHLAEDLKNSKVFEIVEAMRESGDNGMCARSRSEVLRLFGDFELAEPGLVTSSQWRPDGPAKAGWNAEDDGAWAGVAIKPSPLPEGNLRG